MIFVEIIVMLVALVATGMAIHLSKIMQGGIFGKVWKMIALAAFLMFVQDVIYIIEIAGHHYGVTTLGIIGEFIELAGWLAILMASKKAKSVLQVKT